MEPTTASNNMSDHQQQQPQQPPLPLPLPVPPPPSAATALAPALAPALPQLDPLLFTSDPNDLATLPLPARLPQPPALPVPAIPNDTPPDVQPIANYFATFSAKPYLAALVRKSNRQLPDGRPAPTPRDTPDWSLWYIEAVGPSILFWPCTVLPRASTNLAEVGAQWIAHVKTCAMPNFLNITDADVRVSTASSSSALSANDAHLVQLNTAGCNLILLQTASALDQAALVASVRLACFEFSKLHECYTAALLRRPALASLPVSAAPDFHGYVQVRYPGSTEWTRLWCVVTPEPGMTSSTSSNSVTSLLKRKSLALTSSSSNSNLHHHASASSAASSAAAGLVHFYPSKKSNFKKPALSLGNVFQAYAVYPERPHLIDLSMLCKLEGTLVIKDPHPSSPVASPGFVLVMTESPAAMANLLVAIVTRFHLYNVPAARKPGTVAETTPLQITPPRPDRVAAGTLYLDPATMLSRVPVDLDHVATKAWLEKTLAAESASSTPGSPPVTVLPEGAGVTPRQRTPPAARGAGMGRPEATIRPGSMVVTGRAPQLPSDTGTDSDDSDDESSSSNEDDESSSDAEGSDAGSASDGVLAQRSSLLVGGKRQQSPAPAATTGGANGLAKDLARMSVTPAAAPSATASKPLQPRSSGSESGSEDEDESTDSSSSSSASDDDEKDKTPPSSSARAAAAKPAPSPTPKSASPATSTSAKPLPAKPKSSDNSDSGTVSDTEDSDASTTSGSGTDDDSSDSDSSSTGSDESTSDDSGSASDADDDDNQILPATARATASAPYPPQFDPSSMPGAGPALDPYSIDFMAGLGGTGSDNSSQSNLPLGASAASATPMSATTASSFAPNSLLSNPNAAATNRVDTAEPLVPAFVQFGGLLSRPKPSLLAQHQEVQKRQQYYAQLQTFQQQQQMEAAVRQQEQYAVLSRPRGPLLQMASPRDRDREASGLLSVVSQREQTRAQQKHMYGGGGYSSSGVAELVERGAGTGKAVAMDFERDRERLMALEQRQMAKELAEERQRMEEMMQVKREQQRLALHQQQAQQQQQMMWQQQQQQALQAQQQRAAALQQQQQQQQQVAAAGLYGAPPGARGSYYGAPPPAGMMGMQPMAPPQPPAAAGALSSTDSSEEGESGSESGTGSEDESGSESGTSASASESESESESEEDEPPAPAVRKGKASAAAAAAAAPAAKPASRAVAASNDDSSQSDSDDSEPSTPRRRTAGKRQPTAAKSSAKKQAVVAKPSKKQQRALNAAAAPAMPPPMPSPFYGAPGMPGTPGGPPTAPPPQPGMYGAPPPPGTPGALPPGVHPAHAAAYAMQMQHMQQQMYANMGMMSPMMAAMMMQQQQQMAAMHQQMAAMPPPASPMGRKPRKKGGAAKSKKGKKARREVSSSSEDEDESVSAEERSASEEEDVEEESESSDEEERRARRARRKAKGKAGKRK